MKKVVSCIDFWTNYVGPEASLFIEFNIVIVITDCGEAFGEMMQVNI